MGSWVRRSSALALVAFGALACSAGAKSGAPPGVSTPNSADAPAFKFDSLDAREVSSAALAGKPAVLVFVTTFDPISQQQVNYDVEVARDFPDVTFVLIALQDANARELVELYRDTLKVKFPVALGDEATIAGGGTLGDVRQVPTTIVLARDGRIAWRHDGGVMPADLRDRLKKL